MNHSSSYALITGASSGIGADFARVLAGMGINLILVARREALLKELAHELQHQHGVSAHLLSMDLTQRGSAENIFRYCQDNALRVDFLINNAGFGTLGEFTGIDWENESSMIDLNIKVLVELSKLFGRSMALKGFGRIMNVASVAAFLPGPGFAVYFASKAFVLSFSESIAAELRCKGVTVTALCPGPTKSEFGSTSGAGGTKLFELGLVPSLVVAKYGIRSMMRGKTVAIQGVQNKLLVWVVARITPNALLSRIIFRLNR